MPNSTATPSTLTDICRQQENKMAAFKPEVHCISGLALDNNEISMATPTFSTMPDVDIPRSTWPDVGRHRGQKMAAIQTGSGNNQCRATLGHVVSGISESGVVAIVGVNVEIASPSLSVQKLFLLQVCVVAILRSPCRPTSGHVVSGISESGVVANVGVDVETASSSLSVQKLFLLQVSCLSF